MLAFHALRLGYGTEVTLHDLHTRLARGSLTALVGPNGAGKTTLMRAIAGDLTPLGGRIECAARRVSWLPQRTALNTQFPIDVRGFVAMGLWHRIGALRGLTSADAAQLGQALSALGLGALGGQPIGTLSGGQLQRALFARLLLQDADLILLDEPFTAIDHHTTIDLLALVRRWHQEGRTVLAVLHDLEMVRGYFPETLLIAGRQIAHGPTATALSVQTLQQARTAADALTASLAPAAQVRTHGNML
ncbi:metal ABC transporter ATP-binding protein [Xanthomonas prunicola]|jgi:zinc/manganese transport system ATP-binding protein|uniref:ABC transporter n=1 Tax=Xanthomonas prunicola TaxID=2053930 RepID=A0A2N3RJD8_9XANT|nr:ABC transporter ATP-binding protein [Xanthomonas prunicola]PKV12588.1 ABC transporter [Xanthomonas prunicola]PKV16865.1 ABC transporter [Xanthomonas prunicola]PKV20722.1 ABC transporter [Xanthomonas prunicola]